METFQNCIMCGIFESLETRHPIYSSFASHSGSLIKDLLQTVTKNHLPINHQGSYVCKPCFKLVEQFDFSATSVAEIKTQIQEQIKKTHGIYSYTEFVEVACQTEDYLNFLQETIEEEAKVEVLEELKCKVCEETFNSEESLDSHEKTHNDCKFCGNVYRSKSGLYKHLTQKHKEIIETEEVKQEEIETLEPDFIDDLSDFTPEPSEPEPRPKRNSARRKPLSDVDSDDDKPLSLHTYKTEFDRNEETVQRGRGRPKKDPDEIVIKPRIFQCTQCPKKWRTKPELRIHIASHSSVRAHVCEICGRAYKKRNALDVHVGMHNGINPYSCNVCGKVFTQKGALTRHASIHTGQANYQCDLCGKRFIHHTSFSMHALTHSGLKAFKCEVCGLGLMSTSHLKRHMRAHSGEKKFACAQCGKRFAERYNLAAHERLHFTTNESRLKRGHSCPVCSETFPRRQKLEEHLKNNHHKIMDADDSGKWNGGVVNAELPWTAFSHSETGFSLDIKPEQLEILTDSNDMNSP